jgi:simple sugar transport system ATP-binding protein
VDFGVEKGEIHGLMGENGAGKSTLMNILGGVLTPKKGKVAFDGRDITGVDEKQAARHGIRFIHQELNLINDLRVYENLFLGDELTRGPFTDRRRMRERAAEVLKRVHLENVHPNAVVGTLDTCFKQLIEIAKALLYEAKLIIMDEPTTALTKKEVDALFKTVCQLRDSGIAIMFISHKIEEIFEIADDVAIMRNGKNVYLGTTAEITPKEFTYYMTGRQLAEDRFVPKNISKDPVLEVKDLSLESHYNKVSFELRKGDILGITGLLGSGRTELALSLFGLLKPDGGEIRLNGKKVRISSPIAAQKLHIGYVPEDRLTEGLCLQQPIADNITLSSLQRLSNKLGLIKQKDILADANVWVDKFSIATDDARKFASTLSGGNQQKIVLSKWLSNDLDILILNGPTVGVDVGAKQDIHQLIHELANEGLAVIIISDDLAEVVANCSRVIVMKEGLIVGQMESGEISNQAILDIIR